MGVGCIVTCLLLLVEGAVLAQAPPIRIEIQSKAKEISPGASWQGQVVLIGPRGGQAPAVEGVEVTVLSELLRDELAVVIPAGSSSAPFELRYPQVGIDRLSAFTKKFGSHTFLLFVRPAMQRAPGVPEI